MGDAAMDFELYCEGRKKNNIEKKGKRPNSHKEMMTLA